VSVAEGDLILFDPRDPHVHVLVEGPAQVVEQPVELGGLAGADEGSAAIGTAIRSGTVAEVAGAAGFGSCEVVDVDGGFFRIYRLAV
jgi:hypothetical protein